MATSHCLVNGMVQGTTPKSSRVNHHVLHLDRHIQAYSGGIFFSFSDISNYHSVDIFSRGLGIFRILGCVYIYICAYLFIIGSQMPYLVHAMFTRIATNLVQCYVFQWISGSQMKLALETDVRWRIFVLIIPNLWPNILYIKTLKFQNQYPKFDTTHSSISHDAPIK